ncbi:MAG: hypothetical protein QXP77_02250 [Candidatus Aenigmatarchaeota archaeon]
MEEREKIIRKFAEKFYAQVKKRRRNPKGLAEDLRNISSYFQPSLREEKSYEETLKSILGNSLDKSKSEKVFSREWFSLLLGELDDYFPRIKFSVNKIRDSFKKDLLSSFHFPFTQENFWIGFEKYFNFMNEKNIEILANDILKGVSEKKEYTRISLMLGIKRDIIGPVKVVPQVLLSYYTQFFLASLLYVTPPIEGKNGEAAIEILNYYPTNSKLKFFHEVLKSRESVRDLKYNSIDFLNYFLFSKELESALRREK